MEKLFTNTDSILKDTDIATHRRSITTYCYVLEDQAFLGNVQEFLRILDHIEKGIFMLRSLIDEQLQKPEEKSSD